MPVDSTLEDLAERIHKDFKEGLTAFIEKRDPQWKGR
jgi:enoyl-CoA hydratase/carnithine racemase